MYPTTANRRKNRAHMKRVTELFIVIAYFALTAEEEADKRGAMLLPALSLSTSARITTPLRSTKGPCSIKVASR